MAEDVKRLLSHAQVADDQPVVLDPGLDEALCKPAQAFDCPDLPCVVQRVCVRRVLGESQGGFVDQQRIKAFEMALIGHNDHAPQ